MGTVYFLQVEGDPTGPVKIGYTDRKAKNRRTEIQTSHYQNLVVLADVSGTRADEAALKVALQDLNIRGEWFRYEPRLQELLLFLTVDGGTLQSWLEGQGEAMGRQEVKQFRYTCDHKGCGFQCVSEQLPPGWQLVRKEVGPCGMTDYFRTDEAYFCNVCVQLGYHTAWMKE